MSTEDIIVKAIHILSEAMRDSIRKHLKETSDAKELFGLSITQLHYLHAIKEGNKPTITELAERFGVQKSTVTVAISKLLQKGLVEKVPSEIDLRVVHIRLSEKGQHLLRIEEMGYYRFASDMTKALDDEEKAQITRLLSKVVDDITRS